MRADAAGDRTAPGASDARCDRGEREPRRWRDARNARVAPRGARNGPSARNGRDGANARDRAGTLHRAVVRRSEDLPDEDRWAWLRWVVNCRDGVHDQAVHRPRDDIPDYHPIRFPRAWAARSGSGARDDRAVVRYWGANGAPRARLVRPRGGSLRWREPGARSGSGVAVCRHNGSRDPSVPASAEDPSSPPVPREECGCRIADVPWVRSAAGNHEPGAVSPFPRSGATNCRARKDAAFPSHRRDATNHQPPKGAASPSHPRDAGDRRRGQTRAATWVAASVAYSAEVSWTNGAHEGRRDTTIRRLIRRAPRERGR